MPAQLELVNVHAGYGRVRVLYDVSLAVPRGSVVALLGANGAGKTTALRVISGTLGVRSGEVRLDGRSINGHSAYERARAGMTLIPEGRGIFPSLTVEENLAIAVRADRPDRALRASRLETVFGIFPRLAERQTQRAGSLSGGEQQMLALSRAFLAEPRVLLMDEISMGLAPQLVEQLFEAVDALRTQGMTVVLVEQYLTYALRLADVCYVLTKGRITFVGEPEEIRASPALAGYLSA